LGAFCGASGDDTTASFGDLAVSCGASEDDTTASFGDLAVSCGASEDDTTATQPLRQDEYYQNHVFQVNLKKKEGS